MIVLASAQLPPSDRCADLPPSGDPARWPWLQQLRRCASLDPEPWLRAFEAGEIELEPDLLAVLAERLDGSAQLRLLRCWSGQTAPDPRLPGLFGLGRHAATAAWLLEQLQSGPAALEAGMAPELPLALLPLLGHQRQAQAWPVLQAWLQAPIPHALRRAALEGVAVGLPAWPSPALRRCLRQLAADIDPPLAASAVDLLARLPGCRPQLMSLRRRCLDPAVAQRLQRRLATTAAQPLLLVVHGRAGGVLPLELVALAAQLEQRRRAPVRIQALTAAEPPAAAELLRPHMALTLVPLLLLPGGHVRHDLPAIVRHWRRHTPVQRLPFLGAWPSWQQALRQELAAISAPGAGQQELPLLLHHPVEGRLAGRFLSQLERSTAGRCLATPYSSEQLAELQLTLTAPALPLALAANRLTDRLASCVGAPLLQRSQLRQLLLDELEALP
ncbi:MAG: CbiX/SirB N-terminal domain-containing protein [Prochlorococcaceae cyanobacterium]